MKSTRLILTRFRITDFSKFDFYENSDLPFITHNTSNKEIFVQAECFTRNIKWIVYSDTRNTMKYFVKFLKKEFKFSSELNGWKISFLSSSPFLNPIIHIIS